MTTQGAEAAHPATPGEANERGTSAAGEHPATLVEAFQRTARIAPDAVALRTVGDAVAITWGEYARRVHRIAAALAELGVTRGDTLGLMMVNRPEFHLLDTAALHLGACPFSIYNSSAPEQIEHLFANAGNKVVVTQSQFVQRLLDSGAGCVVSLDPAPGALVLGELEAAADPSFDLDAAAHAVAPDDLATLIYTSGTTGPSKGVECTHAQQLAHLQAFTAALEVRFGDAAISFLPSAHIADRALSHYLQLYRGLTVTCVSDPRAIGAALPEVRPTFLAGTPAVYQKIRGVVEAGLAAGPQADRAAVGAAVEKARLDSRGEPVPAQLAAAAAAAQEPVLAPLRRRLGMDRLRFAGTGAAPIPPETLLFFTGLGVPILEAWGMSEACGVGFVNTPGHNKVGSVGRALPGTQVRLAPDGELLFRGAQVMRGYRARPDATAETVDAEGWLHTGDVASIDAEGYVTIIDRKKELIINAAGKNMSPANIEMTIKAAGGLIGNVVAIGDARNYVTALVVLDAEVAAAWAQRNGRPDSSAAALAADPMVRQEIAASVRSANERLSRVEQIKRFRILDRFWAPASEELTPTMKLRRKPIAARYAAQIEELYAEAPGPAILTPGA